jgi:large subunit ribosomal protein L22
MIAMVKKTYQVTITAEKKTAKAFLSNQRISLKNSTEMCREIKGKRMNKADVFVNNIIAHKEFLPLRTYNKKVAHRKGDAQSGVKSGRYPENVCKVFLKLFDVVKANADFKGLDAENLLIIHAFASHGHKRYSSQSKGRVGGKRRVRKSTHIEVVVREVPQ